MTIKAVRRMKRIRVEVERDKIIISKQKRLLCWGDGVLIIQISETT